MPKLLYTSQKQIRAAFWREHPEADREKIRDYSGQGKMYKTDTRVLFVDFVDQLARSGLISADLASRVTLSE